MNFVAQTFQSMIECKLFVDLPGYQSPSIITGDEYRPDLLLSTPNNIFYMVELTVGYESNLANNAKRKKEKYKDLIIKLDENFVSVKFVNLSISSLGVFDKECDTFIEMMNDLGLNDQHQQYCFRKMISIAIRTTYYIFCCRNKEWTNPGLMNIKNNPYNTMTTCDLSSQL